MQANQREPKETDAIKAKLESYAALQRKIDNLIERLDTFMATMGSPSTPNLTGMPSGGSDGTSKIERQVEKKDEMERKLDALIRKERDLRQELENMIEQLERPDEQTVLEMHYIDGSRWWPICAALFSQNKDYAEKEESYLRRTFRIHGSALQHIAAIYQQTTQP